MNSRAIWSIVGFFLFLFGFLAVVLSLVGLKLSFLTWIDAPGKIFGFIARFVMIVAGIMIIYFTRTDWREDEE